MTVKELFILFITLLAVQFLRGQEQFNDTIFFMNGDILLCQIEDDSQIDVVFSYKPRKRLKQKAVHKSEIFGIIKDGEEQTYYLLNNVIGDDLTPEEVKLFMAGQRDARKNYKTQKVFYSGLVLNVLTSSLGEAGLLAVSMPMIVFTSVQYIPYIRIKENTITNPLHRYNTIYAEGYEGVARGKRVMAALKGSALGTLIGSAIYVIALR